MRKILFLIIMAVMVFAADRASAQYGGERMGPPHGMGPGGPRGPRMNSEEMVKARVERLTKDLQLTQEQAVQIEALYKEQAKAREKQREEMRNSGQRPDMEQMRAQMEKERKAMDEKMAKILTPEQNEKYLKMQAERQKGPGMRGPGERGKKGHPNKKKS